MLCYHNNLIRDIVHTTGITNTGVLRCAFRSDTFVKIHVTNPSISVFSFTSLFHRFLRVICEQMEAIVPSCRAYDRALEHGTFYFRLLIAGMEFLTLYWFNQEKMFYHKTISNNALSPPLV